MKEKELSLDELDNIFGGIPIEAGIEKAQELYRQQMIDELKRERDTLTASKEYKEEHANKQSGRSK